MGNLFYRGASPDEIEGMSFSRLKYWNNWHEVMAQAEHDLAERNRG